MGTQPYIGDIMPFGGNFAPQGWALCQGQLLSIAQYSALFSVLGTTYGGDGRTTFGIPDLRGRLPVGMGRGAGLSDRSEGEKGGAETVTLTSDTIPNHTHALAANTGAPSSTTPAYSVLSSQLDSKGDPAPSFAGAANTTMNAGMVGQTGGSQSHNNLQPLLSINFCIALEGIYPSRS